MMPIEISRNLTKFLSDNIPDLHKTKLLCETPDCSPTSSICILIGGNGGVGKSTLIKQLVLKLREREATVAVLAIDPISSITGGAILGDRIRFSERDNDQGLFIRSIGYDQDSENFIESLDYAKNFLTKIGFSWIIIESYGLSQIATDLSTNVDKFVLVISPFNGDDIQFMKSGILEQATHIFVNRQDQVENMLQINSILEALQLIKGDLYIEGQITVGSAKNAIGVERLLDALY
jgi:LAO/AO transport system kinase